MKFLVIGDLHLADRYPGYLDAQVDAVAKIVTGKSLSEEDRIIFLGDVFEKRAPRAKELLAFRQILGLMPYENIDILRGNHDSDNKSDDGISVLSLFDSYDWMSSSQICTYTKYEVVEWDDDIKVHYVPHYEKNETIKEILKLPSKGDLLLGHFGYYGVANSAGFYDSSITPDSFNCTSILGHVHYHHRKDNVMVLGTPYQTSFQEAGKECFTVCGDTDESGFGLVVEPVEFGPRYVVIEESELEENRDFLSDPAYFTMLRVILDPTTSSANKVNFHDIKKEYGVAWVEVRYKALVETEEISSHQYYGRVSTVDANMLKEYVKQNTSDIPLADIWEGYKELT